MSKQTNKQQLVYTFCFLHRKHRALHKVLTKFKAIKDMPYESALPELGVDENLLVHQYEFFTSQLKNAGHDADKSPLFEEIVPAQTTHKHLLSFLTVTRTHRNANKTNYWTATQRL